MFFFKIFFCYGRTFIFFRDRGTIRTLRNVLLFLNISCYLVAPSGLTALNIEDQASKISRALIYADAGLWDRAFDSIGTNAEEPFQNLIEWLKLRSGDGSVKAYISFIDSNPHWPGMQLLRKKAEQKIYIERSKQRIKVHQDILKVFSFLLSFIRILKMKKLFARFYRNNGFGWSLVTVV